MARNKYLSLEEARKLGKLDQFAKEHPSEGDADTFDALFSAMVSGRKAKRQPRGDAGGEQTTPSGAGTSGAEPDAD